MSVLKSKRGESTMQFLETARELEIYTIKQCAKFPKRYMFLITKDIVSLAKALRKCGGSCELSNVGTTKAK